MNDTTKIVTEAERLLSENKIEEAKEILETALEKGDDANVRFALGRIYNALGDLEKAENHLNAAMGKKGENPEYFTELGILHYKKGEIEKAERFFRRALEFNPADFNANLNLAFLARNRNDFHTATKYFEKAAEALPDNFLVNHNLGHVYFQLRDLEKAEKHLQKALETEDNPETNFLLGSVYKERKNFERANAFFEAALKSDPTNARYLTEFASAQLYLGNPRKSLESLEKALAINPHYNEAAVNLAVNYYLLGEYEKAGKMFRALVKKNPNDGAVRFNLAILLLKTGKFDEGLHEYEFRLSEEQKRVLPEIPFWKGENPANKTILILDEQGIGDAIQFARYAKYLKKLGARVILQTKEPLVSLFEKNGVADKIVTEPNETENPDYKIHLMSLPLATGKFPLESKPYLAPTKEKSFVNGGKIKVGIVWRGNPENIYDKYRSLTLERFAKIFAINNAEFFSFQVDATDDEKKKLLQHGVTDWSDKLHSFEDTANFLSGIDLTITVDTAFAHLSGALGKKTLLLIGEQDWRWGIDDEKTPWYESVRLIRKEKFGGWEGAIEQAKKELEKEIETKKNLLALKFAALTALNEGKFAEAGNLLEKYSEIEVDADVYFWLGFLKKNAGDELSAKNYFEKTLEVNPKHADAKNELASIALKNRDFGTAATYYSEIAAEKNDADIYNNLGFALFSLKKFAEAEKCFEKAIALSPKAGFYLNAANNFLEARKFDKALEYYDAAIKLENLRGAHIGKSFVYLYRKNFKKGFEEYAWTLEEKEIPQTLGKKWNGEPLYGKTITVYTEQGLGDSIQFFRFVPKLKSAGARVIIVCAPSLAELFASSKYVDEVRTEFPAASEYFISVSDLPRALGVSSDAEFELPRDLFTFDSARVENYEKSMDKNELNVGLVWRTYSKADTAQARSIPESEIKSLLKIENVRFFILQKDTPIEVEREFTSEFENVRFVKKDLYDLAHFVQALDVVVTIDSLIAHIAGIGFTETYLLLNKFADWRFLLEGETTAWYPTFRIFRQTDYSSWEEPVTRVKETLQKKVAEKNSEHRGIETAEKFIETAEKYFSGGKGKEALEILAEARKRFPNDEKILFKFGFFNHRLGNLDDAIFYYSKTLEQNQLHFDALNNLGVALKESGKFDEAEKFLRLANMLAPEEISALNNLGLLEEHKGNFEKAIEYYDEALRLSPNFRDALLNKSNSLMFLYRFDEAISALDKILQTHPDDVGANYNKGIVYLFKGEFEKGFALYEWRRKRPECLKRNFTKPRLSDKNIAGKRILVYDEQGYGDTIQFCRFIKLLKDCGAYVILQTHATLADLMKNCVGVDKAIPRTTLNDPENLEYDFHIPLLSLPAFFGIKNDKTISYEFPYVKTDMKLKETYRKELFETDKVKVGLVWEGKKPVYNEHRSATLETLIPLIKAFDFNFYSLQQKHVAERNETLMRELGVVDLSEHLHNFSQTAAIMDNLDFVITIDTSMAHLAGALNKKTFVLLSRKADWRWSTGEKTPWYPTHILVRQEKLYDWKTAINKLINKINSFETDFKSIN